MKQLPLPFSAGARPSRIVVGQANAAVLDSFGRTHEWPFRTAVLTGPPRSGKSLLARWFASSGLGEAIDNAERMDETALFHRWNRAQESGTALLLVANAEAGWTVRLPDLASRLGGSLHLAIGPLDERMMGELIALHAELRGFTLGPDATTYLVPRAERSHLGVERLVETIDRLSLERGQPPGPQVWRAALEEINGESQPPLL